MRRVWIAATVLGLSLAGPLAAGSAEPAAAPASTPAAAPAKGDPMVCHAAAATTGSRLGGHKICKRASEWRDQADQSAELVRATQTQSLQSTCTPAFGGNC